MQLMLWLAFMTVAYDVVLLGADGRHHRAEVCVGNWFLGSMTDKVQARFLGP